MLNRGTSTSGACVELCSASLGVGAAGVSGRAVQLSLAPAVRRGVGGAAGNGAVETWCQIGASVREFWHEAARVVARGGLVPACAKIFLGNLARRGGCVLCQYPQRSWGVLAQDTTQPA